jgi:hypothetical protein
LEGAIVYSAGGPKEWLTVRDTLPAIVTALIIDSGADLNPDAKVENQSGCCSPPKSAEKPAGSCCSSSQPSSALSVIGTEPCCSPEGSDSLHEHLKDLPSQYDLNAPEKL